MLARTLLAAAALALPIAAHAEAAKPTDPQIAHIAYTAGVIDIAAAKAKELAKLDGAAFDKAYVANEVAFHKTVNGALQSTLIPSARNPELKSLLQTGLKLFQAHQAHAEHLASTLH
jgi:predicted outer membrane protein